MHPAQTLAAGDVRAAAGLSANVAIGALANARSDASSNAAANPNARGTPGADETYAKGALVVASVAPGLAPFVAVRVGIRDDVEGGITYTGRVVRADVRRSFEVQPHWAMSIGAAGSAAVGGAQSGTALPDVDLAQLHGWGADVPLMIGYESEGALYAVWAGARAGWEHVDTSNARSDVNGAAANAPTLSLSATRFWGGGLLGLAVGFRHVHVAMELDASYASVTGQYNETHTQIAGLILAPAAAVSWQF